MRLQGDDIADAASRPVIAYVPAWLRVAGESAVMPPWVRLEYPHIATLVRELRAMPCSDAQGTTGRITPPSFSPARA
jgi:ATP-dependent DNA helicase RecQ